MTAKNADNDTTLGVSVYFDDDRLVIKIGENELRVHLDRLARTENMSPAFIDQLISRWLVGDWQSLSAAEQDFLDHLSSIAEIDLKIAGQNTVEVITGADILDLLKQFRTM